MSHGVAVVLAGTIFFFFFLKLEAVGVRMMYVSLGKRANLKQLASLRV